MQSTDKLLIETIGPEPVYVEPDETGRFALMCPGWKMYWPPDGSYIALGDGCLITGTPANDEFDPDRDISIGGWTLGEMRDLCALERAARH